jgi:hypothetical protein
MCVARPNDCSRLDGHGLSKWWSMAPQRPRSTIPPTLATLCGELSVLIPSVCLVRTVRLIGFDANGTVERAAAHLGDDNSAEIIAETPEEGRAQAARLNAG